MECENWVEEDSGEEVDQLRVGHFDMSESLELWGWDV